MNQSLEIDFLAVGNGEKSGDAIAIRFGDFSQKSTQKVIIIDGGTKESGQKLCELIRNTYNTNIVDLVVCTHPDADHASGLTEVLGDEDLTIKELLIHRPWEHSEDIKNMFKDGRMTNNSLSERLKEAYKYAHECEKIAINRKVKITEPFEGLTRFDNHVHILNPSLEFYEDLLITSTKTPTAFSESLSSQAFNSIKKWVKESLDIETETLDEEGETSAENQSSVVLLLQFDKYNKYLFTGDAGIESLKKVIDYCNSQNINLSDLRFMQVPHHGSKRNSSPSILNKIKCKTAFISASKDAPKHPAKKVINAYIRRGSNVFTTEGKSLCHSNNAPSRDGFSPAESENFYSEVEE